MNDERPMPGEMWMIDPFVDDDDNSYPEHVWRIGTGHNDELTHTVKVGDPIIIVGSGLSSGYVRVVIPDGSSHHFNIAWIKSQCRRIG